jgi:hypothetical protein
MTTLHYTSNDFNNRTHHPAVSIPCRAPHAARRSPVLSREELQSLILEMVG